MEPQAKLSASINPDVIGAGVTGLTRAQAKITYRGEQTIPIATVVFFADEYIPSIDRFRRFQRGEAAYVNDNLPSVRKFAVSPAEFARILAALKPVLSDEQLRRGAPFLSFTVMRETDKYEEGYEYAVSAESALDFYNRLLSALDSGNRAGREALENQRANIPFPRK